MAVQLTIPSDAMAEADAVVAPVTASAADAAAAADRGLSVPGGASATLVQPAPQSADVFGALINLSGRRRFTSQRVVLYAVLASLGHDGADSTARATLVQLRDAHTTLMEGKGSLPGVFSGQLHDAYFGTLQGDRHIRAFMHLAELVLDAIADNRVGAPALLDQLVKSATPLLSVLNGLTLVYEEQAVRHAQAQRRQLHELMAQLKAVSQHARQLAFKAQVTAARAADGGRDFGTVAASMAQVTTALDALVQQAAERTVA